MPQMSKIQATLTLAFCISTLSYLSAEDVECVNKIRDECFPIQGCYFDPGFERCSSCLTYCHKDYWCNKEDKYVYHRKECRKACREYVDNIITPNESAFCKGKPIPINPKPTDPPTNQGSVPSQVALKDEQMKECVLKFTETQVVIMVVVSPSLVLIIIVILIACVWRYPKLKKIFLKGRKVKAPVEEGLYTCIIEANTRDQSNEETIPMIPMGQSAANGVAGRSLRSVRDTQSVRSIRDRQSVLLGEEIPRESPSTGHPSIHSSRRTSGSSASPVPAKAGPSHENTSAPAKKIYRKPEPKKSPTESSGYETEKNNYESVMINQKLESTGSTARVHHPTQPSSVTGVTKS